MDPFLLAFLIFILFFLLIFTGVPIAFAFTVAGFLGLALTRDLDAALAILGTMPYGWGSTYIFIVLPLFILMGQLVYHSGISTRLFATAYRWIGSQPGGIALATQLASTGFATVSGSSMASAATMGTIAWPELKRYRYHAGLAMGSIAAGGTLGIIIPPSSIFIVYGFMTETSIGKLFIAGIIPGLIMSVLFLLLIYIRCRRNPQLGPPGPRFSWAERLVSLKGVIEVVILFVLVIGGIYTGTVTPVEAAALGAFGAFVITLVTRSLTMARFSAALADTIQTTAMVFFIFVGAQIFNAFLALSGISTLIFEALTGLSLPRTAILILMLLTYIPLGMIMDAMPMILLTLPVFFPAVIEMGFNPVWFGVLVCIMCELANITPPVGLNLFVVRGTDKSVALSEIIRGTLPFAVIMLLVLILLIIFPQISLFLPGLM